MHIITSFEELCGADPNIYDDDERKEYYCHCQAELETIYSLAAQANELALKSRICDVSPYLLIMGNEPKFKANNADIDFTDLHTIDAVDLPNIVNNICASKLPERFNKNYSTLRKLRNKIIHQGAAGVVFDPKKIVALLVEQYSDLWPQHTFVFDWIGYISSTRHSYFHDGKWATAELELREMLDTFFSQLTNGQIKALTGHSKTKRRYTCHECYNNGSLENIGYHYSDFSTAYLTNDTSLHCLTCNETFAVQREDCNDEACKGNVISLSSVQMCGCHTCGEECY